MSGWETKILRRSFLKAAGITVGGLSLGIFPAERLFGADADVAEFRPSAFLHIAPDGKVTIVCHKSEMGQGVRSSLPVLVADELGADLERVTVIQGDLNPLYGEQGTDGSTSVRTNYTPLRVFGATARAILVGVAAKRWGVPADQCDTRRGFALHGPSGRKIPFGELVTEAASVPLPEPSSVSLRPPSQFDYIGKEGLPQTDLDDIVRGRAIFAADVSLPGMLYATIERPPVLRGRVQKVDAAAALGVPGVRQVLTIPSPSAPPCGFKPLGGVAVIAENTWAALRGRSRLSIVWENGPEAAYDSDTDRLRLLKTVRQPGTRMRDFGAVDEAFQKAAKRVEAEYFVPHLAHTPMEPVSAIADFRDGSCEVWACTQGPKELAAQIADTLGIDVSSIKVHVTLLGGGFGRKSKPDFAAEAAWLSRAVGAPVRVQWTREDDIRHDYFHAISAQRFEAGLDGSGAVTAFLHRTAFPSLVTTFQAGVPGATAMELSLGVLDLPFAIPNFRAEVGAAVPSVRIGWLRSVSNIHHGFAVGSFLDEIAAARGEDPRDSLLDILGPARELTSPAEFGVSDLPNYGESLSRHPIDVGRYRGVVEKVTEMARWSARAQNGRHLGLAVHKSFLSYVAVVLSVVKDRAGKIQVDEAWIAGDFGTVVNPERVRAQLEGSILFGLSLAFYGGVTIREGAVVESNFRDHKLVRIGEAPRRIHAEIVRSEKLPGGAGEPGVPPVAAALGNAIFSLTGQRVRELPIRKLGL